MNYFLKYLMAKSKTAYMINCNLYIRNLTQIILVTFFKELSYSKELISIKF